VLRRPRRQITAELGIREQGEAQVLDRGVLGERLALVVAHGEEADARRIEGRLPVSQLPELGQAGRGPDHRAQEHDRRHRIAAIGMEVEAPAGVVGEREGGNRSPGSGPLEKPGSGSRRWLLETGSGP
jgi:hypothetical protein